MIEIHPETKIRSITEEDEVRFHHGIDPWLDSLIARHGMGRLTKLPYDPKTYDFQHLNKGVIHARIPSEQELGSMAADLGSMEALYQAAFEKLRNKGYEAVGQEKYDAMVSDLMAHRGGQTMHEILENLAKSDSTVTILLAHANLQDIPFAQLVVLDALAQAATKENPGLDIFDIIRQSYTYASETMTRLAWDNDPVMRILSGSANAVKVFPPTESGVNLGLDRGVKRYINERTNREMASENERLRAAGRSRLDYSAPAASSMEKVHEDGRLVALKTKKINQVAAQTIADGSQMVIPLAIWFGSDMQLKWKILEPQKFADRSEFYRTMRSLNQATGELAGVKIIEPEQSIGVVASASIR